MLERLVRIFYRKSTVRAIFTCFLFSQVLYLLMEFITFPFISSDSGYRPLDMSTFGYSETYARTFLSSISPEGTELYIFPQLLFLDLLYPFLNGLFLSLTLFFTLKHLVPKGHHVFLVGLLPMLAAIFNYIENAFILKMLVDGPYVADIYIIVGNIFTILKSFTIILSYGLLVFNLILLTGKFLRSLQRDTI